MTKIDALTADVIVEYEDGSIILARRGSAPYKGMWALPGGKMDEGETIEQTAIREIKEETGLDIQLKKVLGVHSQLGRDPRGRYISVVFIATAIAGSLAAASDAQEVLRTKDFANMPLAFDHNKMIEDYLAQKKKS